MTDTMEQVTEDVLDAFKRNGWIVVAPKEPFLSSERQMRVRHGLSDVPVVYRPTFMSKSIA